LKRLLIKKFVFAVSTKKLKVPTHIWCYNFPIFLSCYLTGFSTNIGRDFVTDYEFLTEPISELLNGESLITQFRLTNFNNWTWYCSLSCPKSGPAVTQTTVQFAIKITFRNQTEKE